MQPSVRQQELERLYNSRRGHVPQISISDDNYHVTEALGSYYGDEGPPSPSSPQADRRDPRPLSFLPGPADSIEDQQQAAQLQMRRSRRNGSYFETQHTSPPRKPVASAQMGEKLPGAGGGGGDAAVESGDVNVKRMASIGSDSAERLLQVSPTATPPMSRQPSSENTAVQQFPLNDIDYESSPAAVAQELSNLQAIRRMSMNVDNADPDLPSFAGAMMPAAPARSGDENDTARLFWVPARLHPELAPKEFKTFIEDRVDKIRRRSGESDSLSPDSIERSGSDSSLRRKKSMLSHQIDTKGSYEDGAERLERKRSKGMAVEGSTRVELSELESLVNDPAQLVRRMSLDATRHSLDSGVEVPVDEDMPILPPASQSLKRSTRTTYRKGSLKKGERVQLAKRAQQRQADSEPEDLAGPRPSLLVEEQGLGLTTVQTEPTPPLPRPNTAPQEYPPRQSSIVRSQRELESSQHSNFSPQASQPQDERQQSRPQLSQPEEAPPPPRPQHRQFQSRLASGPGRTTAQLPGYTNPNPLPQIIETLPDGTKVPVGSLVQQIDARRASFDDRERKRSGESMRSFRSGAHSRLIPGREHRSATLDDLSSRPSLLPGSGAMGTDSLTFVPTFDERKTEKKEGPRKSTWKWVFGSDDYDKKAAREERNSDSSSVKSLRNSRLSKQPAEKARLDALQNSLETTGAARGRESLVLSREDYKLDEERRKESKKSAEARRDGGRETGLLSAIFGGKKKSADSEAKDRRRASKIDRALSPDPTPRILKPDIDYNWTRFSILEERAIYRMAHIKLANPRRALHSQVLLSNFMYSYLAKVQLMHPHVQIPAVHQKNHGRHSQQQSQEQQQQQQQPAEYSQYQRWQQQQDREESSASNSASGHSHSTTTRDSRSSTDFDEEARRRHSGGEYDTRSSADEYDYDSQQDHSSHSYQYSTAQSGHGGQSTVHYSTNGGYSVAGTHDYLGYAKADQPFDSHGIDWDDEDDEDEDGGMESANDGARVRGHNSLW